MPQRETKLANVYPLSAEDYTVEEIRLGVKKSTDRFHAASRRYIAQESEMFYWRNLYLGVYGITADNIGKEFWLARHGTSEAARCLLAAILPDGTFIVVILEPGGGKTGEPVPLSYRYASDMKKSVRQGTNKEE